jgi:hypothetical protein
MEYRPAVGDPFVSNTSLKLLTVRVVTSFGFGALYNGYEIGKLPLRTFSTFLLEHVNILLPLCGTPMTFPFATSFSRVNVRRQNTSSRICRTSR